MEDFFSFDIMVSGKNYHFDVETIHRGEKLLKFLLKIKGNELKLQKKLDAKKNQWGILSSTFEFKREDAAYTLLRICKILDGFIGTTKIEFDQQKRKKD